MEVIFKILLVVLGLGFIIFVHELGHFLVAKWCRVRCEVFSCGFGHPILWFRPKYAWRPGEKDFKYNDVLGPELLHDHKRLREYLATKPGSRVGNRLRILKWPVEKLVPGMVQAQIVEGEADAARGLKPVQLDAEKIAALKAAGTASIDVFDAGETEYRISWIPLGGFVAMAGGETPGEGAQGLPDEFLSKSPGQRAAILVAGVTMNIITAFLFFIIAYTIGVETPPAVIGDASSIVGTPSDPYNPGPAWIAGLKPGDRIVNMNFRKVGEAAPADVKEINEDLDFNEFRVSVAFADHDDIIRLTVLRPTDEGEEVAGAVNANGETASANDKKYEYIFLDVRPVYDAQRGFMVVGVSQIGTPQVEAIASDRAEALEGKLQVKDLIVAVEGHELPPAFPMPDGEQADANQPWPRSYVEFQRRLQQVKGDEVTLTVLRNGERVQTTVPFYTVPQRLRLGLDSLPVVPAKAVRPGGPAAQAVKAVKNDAGEWVPSGETFPMQPGDSLVAVRGERAQSYEHMKRMIQALTANQPAHMTLSRAGEGTATEHEVFIAPRADWRTGDLVVEFIPELSQVRGENATPMALKIFGIDPDGPAAKAEFVQAENVPEGATVEQKLLPGDVVLQVADQPVTSWSATGEGTSVDEVIMKGWDTSKTTGVAVRVKVQRDIQVSSGAEGETKPATVTLEFQVTPMAYGTDLARQIGFLPAVAMVTVHHTGLKGIQVGMWKTWMMAKQVFLTLRSIFGGTVAAKNIGGPVMIATVSYKFAGWGLGTFLYFMAIISINLAIINILPIPILDGGHLVFVGIEKLRGKPVPERIQNIATYIGLFLILALIIFVMYNDIHRLITNGL